MVVSTVTVPRQAFWRQLSFSGAMPAAVTATVPVEIAACGARGLGGAGGAGGGGAGGNGGGVGVGGGGSGGGVGGGGGATNAHAARLISVPQSSSVPVSWTAWSRTLSAQVPCCCSPSNADSGCSGRNLPLNGAA